MSEDFLSRWSRRKQQAETDGTLSGNRGAEQPEEPSADVSAGEALPELTAEEIAALPEPDDVASPEDLLAFLRKGVPEVIRNRALRRMWSIDPSIRDYIGDARDYAWDWNVPGGMPVSGPLDPRTDVRRMIRDIFGEKDPSELQKDAFFSKDEGDRSQSTEIVQVRGEAHEALAASRPAATPVLGTDKLEPVADVDEQPLPPRRHGGALPR
jgi:hypothetical protein